MNAGALQGTGVLVTRPAEQNGELCDAIEAAGGYAFRLPVLKIEPRGADSLRRDFSTIQAPDIIIYVSRNAVLYGAELLKALTSDATRIAAIGPATQSALADAGFTTDIRTSSKFDSEHLLEHAELKDPAKKNILIVRGNRGRELLANTLRSRGAEVNHVAVYDRITAAPDNRTLARLQSEWLSGKIDTVVAMSVDSLVSLIEILPDDCHALLAESLLVTPSKRVIQKCQEILPSARAMLSDGIGTEDLIDTIIQSRQTQRKFGNPKDEI